MNASHITHMARLESDYNSMQQIHGEVIKWEGLPPANPAQKIYPNKYRVTYHILTPTVRGDLREHIVEIDCSSLHYPGQPPIVRFLTPLVKHPHVFEDGKVCLGGFPLEESLAELCVRLARFLQYDPATINLNSAVTYDAKNWYLQNRHRFPIDHSPLPRLGEDSGFKRKVIRQAPQPSFDEVSSNMTVKRQRPGNSYPPR